MFGDDVPGIGYIFCFVLFLNPGFALPIAWNVNLF